MQKQEANLIAREVVRILLQSSNFTEAIQSKVADYNDEILDIHKARKLLSISEATLRRYVVKGKVPYFKIGGHLIRFSRNTLLDWCKK